MFFLQLDMPKKSTNFCEDNIAAVILAVDNGMSKKSASKQFNINRSTLQFRLKNRDRPTFNCGPSSILTKLEEEILVRWLLECSKKGFPRRKKDLQLSVKQFLDEQGRSSPFKNNYPGNYIVFYVPIRSLFKFETIQNKIH